MIRKDFETFLTIYEEKSLSRAADRLDKYQGALSKLLAQLEEEIGYSLFVRSNRGLIATQEAEELYAQVSLQKKQWEKFNSGLLYMKDQVSGVLRVGGHESILSQVMHSLSKLHNEFPALEIQYSLGRSPEVVRKVLNHELDLAFVANPQMFPDLVIRPFKSEEVALFAATEKPRGLVTYNPDLISSSMILKSFSKKYTELIPSKDYHFAAELAKALKGVALLPQSIAKQHKLPYQMSKAFMKAKICLIYRSDRKIDKKITSILKPL